MSKETKNRMVPTLRFPEFEKSSEWVATLFGKLNLDVGDGNYSSKYPNQSDFLLSGVPFLRANNLKFGTVSDEDMRFISENQHKDITKGHLKKGDILISTRGELGVIALVPDRHIGSNINAQLVRINSGDKLPNTFLFQLLNCLKANGVFDSISTGTALKQLPLGKLNQLKLWIPESKREQQKIGSCLSSLDELITAENQKLEALKEHKKGLMQQLFPAEGKKVPELRFAEFKGSGEWEEDVLERKGIASFINEKIPLDELQLENYVSTENLLPNYGDKTMSSNLPSSGSSTRYRKNDILLSNIRPYLRKVWLANINGGASNDIIVIRAEHKLEPSFLSLLLRNDKFINYIMKGAEGVKMPRGDKDLIKLYPLAFPQKEEQKKIAECIFCLDELITEQAERIEALKQHKKGLMQGLFPSEL